MKIIGICIWLLTSSCALSAMTREKMTQEEAIAAIQADPSRALEKNYLRYFKSEQDIRPIIDEFLKPENFNALVRKEHGRHMRVQALQDVVRSGLTQGTQQSGGYEAKIKQLLLESNSAEGTEKVVADKVTQLLVESSASVKTEKSAADEIAEMAALADQLDTPKASFLKKLLSRK